MFNHTCIISDDYGRGHLMMCSLWHLAILPALLLFLFYCGSRLWFRFHIGCNPKFCCSQVQKSSLPCCQHGMSIDRGTTIPRYVFFCDTSCMMSLENQFSNNLRGIFPSLVQFLLQLFFSETILMSILYLTLFFSPFFIIRQTDGPSIYYNRHSNERERPTHHITVYC